MHCLQPSSPSTATLSTDKRNISTLAEITTHAGKLLVADLAGSVATYPAIPLRQITHMTLGTNPARKSRSPVALSRAENLTLQVCQRREITVAAARLLQVAAEAARRPLERAMAHFALLGASCLTVPNLPGEQLRARARFSRLRSVWRRALWHMWGGLEEVHTPPLTPPPLPHR